MSSNGVISLAELMNHHRDLLVQPICWTSRHLEMLGCRFEHFDHVPTPTDDINPDANTWRPIYNDNELEKRPDLLYEEDFAEGHFSLCPHVYFGRLVRPLLNRKWCAIQAIPCNTLVHPTMTDLLLAVKHHISFLQIRGFIDLNTAYSIALVNAASQLTRHRGQSSDICTIVVLKSIAKRCFHFLILRKVIVTVPGGKFS
jgi:hypothetical protein